MGGAVLERHLTEALRKKLHPDRAVAKELFDPQLNGALSTYGAKARVGYMLGLFSKDAMDELNAIGRIRNEFAHNPDSLFFTTQSIKDRCLNLKYLERVIVPHDGRTSSGTMLFSMWTEDAGTRKYGINYVISDADAEKYLKDPRWRYEFTIQIFCFALKEWKSSGPDTPRF